MKSSPRGFHAIWMILDDVACSYTVSSGLILILIILSCYILLLKLYVSVYTVVASALEENVTSRETKSVNIVNTKQMSAPSVPKGYSFWRPWLLSSRSKWAP